jgi:hypothetical protein
MISLLVCAISVLAVIQFLITYCRSILTAASRVELSERTLKAAGLPVPEPAEKEFERLMQLAELCPMPGKSIPETDVIVAYHNALGIVHQVAEGRSKAVERWVVRERARCTYFAAVHLDQRLAFTQDLLREFYPFP